MAHPALKKQSAEADRIFQEVYGDKSDEEPASDDKTAAPTESQVPADQQQPGESDEDYKARYETLQGKYNAEISTLVQQNAELQKTLDAIQNTPAPETPAPVNSSLTEEDIKEYGEDMIDVVRKIVRDETAPGFQTLQEQQKQFQQGVGTISQTLVKGARERMLADLQAAVPNYETLNYDAKFLDWLKQQDVYSGETRHTLLTRAFEANDSPRVIAFFKGYLQGQTGSTSTAQPSGLETLVAPGRPAGTQGDGAQTNGKVWTQREIQQAFKARQAGHIKDKEWGPIEADIYSAQREGRVT